MSKQTVYFPNLNGIRFLAATFVIIHHVGLAFPYLKDYFISHFINEIGKLGVNLFFVLSGFLITFLLLTEKKITGSVSIRKFYVRRILRIWPLYFFIVILGLFILQEIIFFRLPGQYEILHKDFGTKILLFFLILPNAVYAFFPYIPYLSQTWSIGVEEQFYLMWPFIIKKVKKTFNALIIIILSYLFIRYALLLLSIAITSQFLNKFIFLWNFFLIDSMAIGGIAAYILFEKKKALNFLFNPYFFYCILIICILFIISGVNIGTLNFEFYAILFAIIIANLAGNKVYDKVLEYKALDYFGKISYGIYMYHLIVVESSLKYLHYYKIYNPFLHALLSIFLTIAIASVSYEFFEKRILRLKQKFTIIVSGNKKLQSN